MEPDNAQRAAWEAERQACATPVRITIETRAPSKWRFVDLETGSIWEWGPKTVGENAGFKRSSIPAIFACNYIEDENIIDYSIAGSPKEDM
jgi:hypothetical protein